MASCIGLSPLDAYKNVRLRGRMRESCGVSSVGCRAEDLFTQLIPSSRYDSCKMGHEVVLGVLEVRDYKATLHRAIEERRKAMSKLLRAS